MPVSVGKSYVSEAAYSYAQSRMAGESKAGGKSGDVLKSLADEFGDTKFSVGSAPFSGTGTRNISIAPNILQQMAEDPEKRMEYEALIYDCNDFQKNRPQSIGGMKIKASGFIIDKDGGLRSWSISESDGGDRKPEASGVRRTREKGWWRSLLDGMKERKEKTEPKAREVPESKNALARDSEELTALLREQRQTLDERLKAHAERVTSFQNNGNPAIAKAYLAGTNAAAKVQGFSDTNELMNYLRDKFTVVKEGLTSISSKYLRDCLKDGEKRARLLDNLLSADNALDYGRKNIKGFQGMTVSIDEDGEMTLTSGRRTVTFNGAKMARMIAAAQNSGDIKTVMNLLQIDLKQCEDGLRDGACDEAEVEKVRAMMDEAQKRKAELAGVEDDSKGFDQFSISMLI